MGKLKNLTGQRFGKLLVLDCYEQRIMPNGSVRTFWKCLCDCGNEKFISRNHLLNGTKSCGCLHKEAGLRQIKNIIGQRFGRLVVIGLPKSEKRNGQYRSLWLCKCDCGNTAWVNVSSLKLGHTTSCGCAFIERVSNITRSHSLAYKTPLYQIWKGIKARCFNPNNKGYENYGGRGITMCNEWRNDFKSFYDWAMANGYKEEKLPSGYNKWTIDRVNNDGNYEPSNCRWVTMFAQNHNKRKKLNE